MFKKITDERLLVKNLRNIRIAFSVQTLGILIILGWKMVAEGASAATNEPLWLVWLVSMIVLIALSIPVSRENNEA